MKGPRQPLIRLAKNGRIFLSEEWTAPGKLTMEIVLDRRRQPECTDNEYWWIRGAQLTPAAALKLRDQIDAWLKAGPPVKRPPRISPEAASRRRPLPAVALLQPEIPAKPTAGRLIASKTIRKAGRK